MSRRYARMRHWDWIERNTGQTCSPLGRKAAYILGAALGGIYNVPMKPEKTKWSDPGVITVVVSHKDYSTFDFSGLTNLVLLAHALAVRVSIIAVAPRCMRLRFHLRRHGEDLDYWERHPTPREMADAFEDWFQAEAPFDTAEPTPAPPGSGAAS